jgi:tetratricopeptide (TPR) repeat protein
LSATFAGESTAMSLNNIRVLILLTATCAGIAQAAPHRKHKHPKPDTPPVAAAPQTATTAADPEMMLVTTSSPNARSLYEEGMTYWENVKIDKALEAWRNAAKEDPQFALAHLQVSYVSTDPVEQSRERGAAKELAPKVTPAEQLLIAWLSGVREDRYIEAIAAMNDLVQRFPKDKHVHLWAGSWLLRMNQYEAARKQLEVAVALDGNYAPALNDLGYTCASLGDHTRAVEFMQRYVALLPSEPNPEDSFGEILRISGHFDEALEHYRKALAIDPKFHSSLLGLADTYSLMGEQRKAREEYSHARMLTSDKLTDLSDELQSALTYVRERDTTGADQALMIVGQHAHGIGSAVV